MKRRRKSRFSFAYFTAAVLALSGAYIMCSAIFLQNATPNPHHIVLTTKNTVTIRGEINSSSTTQAQLELHALDLLRSKDNYPIYLVLDSPGGSVISGNSFIAYAKTIKNVKTITLDAASMAAMIVQALPGERLHTEDSTMMFHRASVSVQGQISEGEVESQLAYIKKIVKKVSEKVAARMGLTYDQYQEKIVNELWLYSDELLTQKASDRKVEVSCDAELVAKRIKKTIVSFFFTAEVEYSACPLFRSAL